MPSLPVVEISPGEMADELAEAWEAYRKTQPKRNDPGLTSREYAELKGISNIVARRRIKELKEAGKIIEGKRTVRNSRNHLINIPVYRLKKEEEDIA